MNKLPGNSSLNFVSLLNHYLGLKQQFLTINEETSNILGAITNCVEKLAPEEQIQPCYRPK